jgi:hypothetical protein
VVYVPGQSVITGIFDVHVDTIAVDEERIIQNFGCFGRRIGII